MYLATFQRSFKGNKKNNESTIDLLLSQARQKEKMNRHEMIQNHTHLMQLPRIKSQNIQQSNTYITGLS